MPTNFIFNNGGNNADFSDVFIPVSAFAQGGLWGWGINDIGQLGDNTIVNKSSPVQTIAGGINWKQVSTASHQVAIKTDGTLWLWGTNSGGQLGNGGFTNVSSPIQTVSGGTNWLQASGGQSESAAIKTDGTLWIWGNNANGQLGDNTVVTRSSPIQTIAGGAIWKQVSLSLYGSTTTAIKTDGTLWLWGYNDIGQLGNNDIIKVSSPIQTVSGGTNWKQVSIGSSYTASIKTDGTLWLWGINDIGQLGDNTIVNKSSPVQTVSGGTNWKQVACGFAHTAAIKTDGTLWLWGRNWVPVGSFPVVSTVVGMIGTNVQILNYSEPVQTVSGGTNWKQVSCGNNQTAAIKTDGTLWTWGRNNLGQLGDNTRTNVSSPIQTISGGTNWKQVACGFACTAAVQNNF